MQEIKTNLGLDGEDDYGFLLYWEYDMLWCVRREGEEDRC